MTLSENSARAVSKYVRAMIRRQPHWLRTLFDTEKICFTLEEDGSLSLAVHDDLTPQQKEHAGQLITGYIEKHPANFIQITKIH